MENIFVLPLNKLKLNVYYLNKSRFIRNRKTV